MSTQVVYAPHTFDFSPMNDNHIDAYGADPQMDFDLMGGLLPSLPPVPAVEPEQPPKSRRGGR